jgi:hypothetical protein
MRPFLLAALFAIAAVACSFDGPHAPAHAGEGPGLVAQAQPGDSLERADSLDAAPDSSAVRDSSTAPASSSAGESAKADGGGEFAPTSEVPWNPPEKVHAAETWETVLRTPGRLLSLPLVAVGGLTRPALLMVQETDLIPRVMYVLQFRQRGLVLTPASLGDRTGLGATVGFALPMPNPHIHAGFSASARKYNSTGVGVSGGPFKLDYAYGWRPQELFFGFGLNSSLDQRSTFASQSEFVQFAATFPQPRRDRKPASAHLSGWVGPRSLVVRQGRSREEEIPSFEQPFPDLAPMLDHRVEHLTYGGRAELDRRAGGPHWSHGHRVAFQVDRFDRPIEALALHSGRAEGAEFTRMRLEAEIARSFSRDPRTLRLSFAAVDQRLSKGSRPMGLPDFVTLGGSAGLGGFEAGRFHDLDLLELELMYIFPLLKFLEFDLHAEAGGVYSDIEHDARLDSLKGSYGFAFRPRLPTGPLGAIGLDWSAERARFRFSLGGVE